MNMTLNRDHTLRHKSGLSIEFKEGVATHVPPRVVADALALGAAPAEKDADSAEAVKRVIDASKDEAAARAPAIEAAIRKLLARNQRGDFTAAGRPNLVKLFQETQLEVSAQELDPIWAKVKEGIE